MGLNASGDVFNIRTDALISDIPEAQKIVDDILLVRSKQARITKRMEMVFKKARRMNVSISKEKLQIGKKVSFAGYTVDGAGVHADVTKTAAICEFPVPKTIKDVRSFLGLANQLGNFVPNLGYGNRSYLGTVERKYQVERWN